MKKWTTNDYTYAMDSDVISHGYEIDLQREEDENYDLSGILLLKIICRLCGHLRWYY